MDDLVNRTSVIKAINNMVKECDSIYATSALRNLEAIVKDLPSAQPKHDISKANFLCPICGAEMEVEVSEWEGEG